jgi:hypothetical protein
MAQNAKSKVKGYGSKAKEAAKKIIKKIPFIIIRTYTGKLVNSSRSL